ALFKAGETVPSDTVGVSWVTIGTGNTGVDMDTLNLVITSGEVAIDELRFGNSWQSVTQGSELVESVYPVSGATGVSVDPTNKVTIKFRTVMDEPSVEDALSISPEIANAKFNWVNNELRISGDRLLDSTWYSVTVKRSAKTNNNLSLMEGFQFTFLTSNNTPVVTNISPEDGEMDVNPVSSVVIDFSKSMNVDSVENNIRFYPEVSDPLYSWSIDSSTVSIFLSNLLSDRLYAISIDTGAVDFNGDRLESIYNSSFITGDNTIWVYDDFQIAGDTLKTNGNSGYGWGGDWYYDSGNEDILINESASLSYPSSTSASSQVGYIYKTSVGETRIERTLSNGYDLKNTNQYLSFLAEKQSGSSLELQGYDSNYSLRFGVRVTSSGEVQVRAGGQWSSASTSGSFSNDQTYLVVIAKESDLNRVALFKEGDSIPSSLTAVNWIASEVGTTGITLDRIRLKINGAAKFDEFRFCNSWTGAVFGNVSQSNARSALIPENIQSDENLPPTLTLYPNPAIDEICLKLENTSDTAFNFQIMNLAGAKVLDEKIDLRRESPSLDISALTEGCYVVIVTSESHQIIKKIIVK
ncbi:MAG: Ig-like domain-containing protein, partial [Cyclobacteriaceae bacterium]